MTRRLISTGSPFEKTAGYSRAVVDGDFAFVAGTTGYDYATMTMPSDVMSQSRNCFKTIEAALKEAGFAMADIVRATYYSTSRMRTRTCLSVAKSWARSGRRRRSWWSRAC
jgi:enamine deaminase RidA (YjgF/YER057c/UK114 family)